MFNKRIMLMFFSIIFILSGVNTAFSKALFIDVPEDYWANNFIEEMQSMGAVNGYPDGTFKPENPVTRAEFCAMTVLAAGIIPGSKDNPKQWLYDYTDNNHWANEYMKSMFYFTDYYGEWYLKDNMQPDSYVNRAEVAMGLNEIVDANGMPHSIAGIEEEVKKELKEKFSDYEEFGGHTASIYFANKKGLINGYPDGTFKPSKLVTRAELCTMLYLAYSKNVEDNISTEHKDEVKYAGNVLYTVNKDTYYLYRAMNNRLSVINGIGRLTEEDLKKRVNGNAGDTLINDVLSFLTYYSTTNSLSASIIRFVQDDINYLNDPDNRDYAKFPYETLYDGGGDCEDKSILMCSLLKNAGYDVCLIVFSDHVGVGVAVNEPIEDGYYYTLNNEDYYYLETTSSGWLPGELPEKYIDEKATLLLP